MSLLAMTQDDTDRTCLAFRLLGSSDPLESFGHEYIRHLSGQISAEYADCVSAEPPKPVDEIMALANVIVPYYMTHNAEAEGCDLAMEVESLQLLIDSVHTDAVSRVTLYLLSCVPYVPEPEDSNLMRTCLTIFRNFDQYPQAMQMALKLNDKEVITDVFVSCKERHIRRQLTFMLARQQIVLDVEELLEEELEDDDDEIELLAGLMRNTKLNDSFLELARELDIVEAKTPEDVYKSHLEGGSRAATNVDSARNNLASTFVNAFVNAGFGPDKLILGAGTSDDASGSKRQEWIWRNKDSGKMSAAASLGMLLLWDVDGGLQRIDPYLLAEDEDVKAGALLAIGILNSGVSDENDPAWALLHEYVDNETMKFRVGSIAALGMAYAGSGGKNSSGEEDLGALLVPVLTDPKSTMEVVGITALALGQIYVGTCDGHITEQIMNVLMDKSSEEAALSGPWARFIVLGLGLLYLGRQAEAEVAMQAMVALPEAFQKFAKMLLDCCAYAGTGNVLKVQALLHACSEHVDVDGDDAKEGDDTFQAFATLGVAMVAMGEDVGLDMVLRMFNHLMQYGEPVIRRAVPIAIALLCVSNPKLTVLDQLSKLSHDPDPETAYNAIFAIGIVGAGTNHARIAAMLRTLAQYYSKDPNTLFVVRLAQGIVHAGKGSITFTPFHTERSLLSPVSVCGLLSTLVAALDMKNTLMKTGKDGAHYLLFELALAMYPRIFCTFADDDELTPINTSVRVGQAVDVVGQAGKPKAITGFITNNTPVLLGHGERSQLATDEFLSLTPFLEGFVILKKNPEFEG